jgi:hypothetical protein
MSRWSSRDDNRLRAGGSQLEPLRQRAGHHAECCTGVYKKLNYFHASGWTGQTTFYVNQSPIKNLRKNEFIVAQLTYKTNRLQVTFSGRLDARIAWRFT